MKWENVDFKPKMRQKLVMKQNGEAVSFGLNSIEYYPEKIAEKIKYQANLIKVQARDLRTALKIITFVPRILLMLDSSITEERLIYIANSFRQILSYHNSMVNLWEKLWEKKYYVYLSTTSWQRQPLESRIEEIISKIEVIINKKSENPAIRETRINILKMVLEQTLTECRNRIIVWK